MGNRITQKTSRGLVILVALSLLFQIVPVRANGLPANEFQNQSETEILLNIEVPVDTIQITTLTQDGQTFSTIEIPEWSKSQEAGKPSLPVALQAVGVPVGTLLSIRVIPGTSREIKLDYPVIPVVTQSIETDLEVLLLGEEMVTEVRASLWMNSEIYHSAQPYPTELAKIASDGLLRSQRIVGVQMNPFIYHPDTQTITVYDSLQVKVIFKASRADYAISSVSESDLYEDFFQVSLENYSQAKQWRQDPSSTITLPKNLESTNTQSAVNTGAWLPPSPGYRIPLAESGFYRLTYEALLAAGLPVGAIDPQTLQIFSQGQEIAIQVISAIDNQFASGDEIRFFANVLPDKYSKEQSYWLTYGQTNGIRMATLDGIPTTGISAASYQENLYFEKNLGYRSLMEGEDDFERFYWGVLYTTSVAYQTWNHTFQLLEPQQGVATLTLNLGGLVRHQELNLDHHAWVKVNNVLIADVWWDGFAKKEVQAPIPQDVLVPGNNTLTIYAPNDTGMYDAFYVDNFGLQFPSGFAVNPSLGVHQFAFDTVGSWQFPLTGFQTSDVVVLDISDPYQVREVENFTISGAAAPYTVTFQAEITTPSDFYVTTTAAIKNITAPSILLDTASSLTSTENSAEFIVISHKDFLSEAARLVAHRTTQGMSSLLIDVQDVYDEFNFGNTSPYAIRHFLAHAYTHWQNPTPSYVLLVGDGNYDPKQYLSGSAKTYIAPLLVSVDPWEGENAGDNRMVSISGSDNMPDLMLGRFPVNNLAQAQAMVDKVIAYEANTTDLDWARKVLMVAGSTDSAGDFATLADNLISQTLPLPYEAEKAYFGVSPYTDQAAAKTALKSEINEGALIVNFLGHGSVSEWTAQKIPTPANFLAASEVPTLQNAGKLPIILAMTCNEGSFHERTGTSMGEAMTRTANVGAIASWSPTGQGVAGAHDYLNRGFFKSLFQYGKPTVGEAVSMGNFSLWISGNDLYTLDNYILLGDPTLLIARPAMAVDDFYFAAEDYPLTVNAANGVLKNDSGLARGNPLTATLTQTTSFGSLVFNADGSFTYESNSDWYGTDMFTYSLVDDITVIGEAVVKIIVAPTDELIFLPIVIAD